MPIAYSLDRSANIIFETWSGIISASDLASYWHEYLANPEVMKCRRTLLDLRDASIEFTGAELQEMIQHIVVPALGARGWITAILVDRPVQYGTSRQYNVFAQQFSSDTIFEDRNEALIWLLKQEHPSE